MKIELGSPRYLRWAPNNRYLVFSAASGGSGHLFVVNTLNGQIRELATPGLSPRGADWSSDGRSLLFPAYDGGDVRLWRMSLAPSGAPQPASPIGWGSALQQGDVLLVGRPFEDGVWRLSADGRSTLLTPEVQSADRIPAWTVWRDHLYYIYMPTETDGHLPTNSDGYLYSRPIAAVTPAVGLSYLEDAIGETGRGGIIHATPGTVAAWDDIETVNGVLTTVNGTPIASGGGYIGADPVAGATAAAGQAWAFATGPVQVRLSDVVLVGEDINGTLDTSSNDVTFRAEIYALPVWDHGAPGRNLDRLVAVSLDDSSPKEEERAWL